MQSSTASTDGPGLEYVCKRQMNNANGDDATPQENTRLRAMRNGNEES